MNFVFFQGSSSHGEGANMCVSVMLNLAGHRCSQLRADFNSNQRGRVVAENAVKLPSPLLRF